jgi:IS605 OrfB family transposase
MLQVLRYRVKGKASRKKLEKAAFDVNQVFNWCNDLQRQAVRNGRPWLRAFDLNNLASGGCEEMDLGAETIQAVCEQYAQSRIQHKKRWLRYRGKRALGWVPFKARGIRQLDDGFKFRGHVYRVWLSRPVFGKIKCGSFSQDARGHWYINLCVDVSFAWVCPDKQVGIDLGLKTTATMSDGQKYDGLRAYRAVEESLGKAQRAHKKKRVKALHAKAKNRRLDGLHKLSTQLVRDNQVVVVGDVSSKNLGKTKMAKSVYDAGWGLLKNMLRYKSIAKGVTYREVNEAYSSQLCSACGSLPESRPRGIAQLGIREWVCSNCGQGHDRDINAARNILALGCERPVEGILAL